MVTLLAAACAPFPCQILRKESCLGNTSPGTMSDNLELFISTIELTSSATHKECCNFPGKKSHSEYANWNKRKSQVSICILYLEIGRESR